MMKIGLILCGVAAAEIAAQPSICIDPPPQSHNATLNAVVERAYDPKTPLADGICKLVAWYREAQVRRPALVRVVTPEDPLHDLRDLKPAVLRCGLVSTSDRPAWTRPPRDAQVDP